MNSWFRAHVAPFLIAVLITLSGVACDQETTQRTSAPITFPPTPTFPVVAAPILLPGVTRETVAEASSPTTRNRDSQSEQKPIRPAQAKETATAVAPSTPTPPATEAPTPTATIVPSPTPCAMPGEMVLGQFDSKTGNRIGYRVYLPPCYADSGRTYPVLYMLPGNVHTDSIWDELGIDEAAEAGVAQKDLPPFIIVMLAGGSLANNTSGGDGSYESFFLEEFMPYIEDTYCAAPNADGRAIGGMSRGGYWALEIAFRHPDLFASVGGHSAALLDFNGGPTINPLDTGLDKELGDLRVYLDIGEDDWLIDNVRSLHEQMTAAGREHTWILNEGYHEDGYWAAHVVEYLDWYTAPWPADAESYPLCRAREEERAS